MSYLATLFNAVQHFLQEVAFPAAFGVSDCGGVSALRDEEIGTAFVDPSSTEMTIRRHVVVPGVDD